MRDSSPTGKPAAIDLASTTGLVLVLLVSTAVVAIFHNRFWAAADDGNYAHVAERILSGQTLHRDVQDLHAGYIDFLNAAAFSVFGIRLVSMRYPLALLTVVQSGIMFLLLRSRGVLTGMVGALTLTALSFVQFLNPTANWYCLFLAVSTIAWLSWVPAGQRGRHLVTGVLVGTAFLFRQLSGVFLGIGVLVYLILERPAPSREEPRALAHVLLLLLTLGIGFYLLRATDAVGWLLFGVWLFPILFHAWRRIAMSNRELAGALLGLSLGALISALPLMVYHIGHGSVRAWLGDTIGASVALPRLAFMTRPGYLIMAGLAGQGLLSGGVAERLNAVFWLGLLALTGVLGMVFLRTLTRVTDRPLVHPLPVIALFYALVSLHYQLPIYLFYSVGLTGAAVIWLTSGTRKASATLVLAAGLAGGAIALYYQAAMPLSRGLAGIVAGERRWPKSPLALPRAGLLVDSLDAAHYSSLIGLIDREAAPGDTIFTLPTNAELYFLSRRTNPFKFYNTALGIASPADLELVLRTLRCHPPKLVFYRPQDKYNTAASGQIAAYVRARYEAPVDLPPFEVFRRPEGGSAHPSAERGCSTRSATGGFAPGPAGGQQGPGEP